MVVIPEARARQRQQYHVGWRWAVSAVTAVI